MSPPVDPELTPPQTTRYPRTISLGAAAEADGGGPMTAIYVPPGVDTTKDKVNLVLWLHGHKDIQPPNVQTYLNDARFALREIMASRGAKGVSGTPSGTSTVMVAPPVVMVAPTLGALDESGTLATDAEGYLKQAKQAMTSLLSFPASVSWPQVVIGCHSGGGKVAKEIAAQVAMAASNQGGKLAEIWHFDSLYENDPQTAADPEPTASWWASWAGFNPGTQIKVFHLTTTAHSLYLQASAAKQGFTNVTVKPSTDKTHATVARTHFPECYDAWLVAMSTPAPAPPAPAAP
jgi:hypothetical protein